MYPPTDGNEFQEHQGPNPLQLASPHGGTMYGPIKFMGQKEVKLHLKMRTWIVYPISERLHTSLKLCSHSWDESPE